MHVVGLHVHLFTGWISPDGLPHGGLLEIKCQSQEKLSKAFEEVRRGNFRKEYVDTYSVHGIYRGCHIIWKWVKIGVITNLRISEFDLRHEEDDNIVIIPCAPQNGCTSHGSISGDD